MKRESIEKIEFKNFSLEYDGDVSLFEGIHIEFPMAKSVRIRTDAGRGSSSVLQILGGLKTGEGEYLINGRNVFEMSFEEFLPYRLSIGYAFDYGGLINNMTIEQNLLLPLEYHQAMPEAEAKAWVMELLTKLGIAEYAHRRPAMVTGGVRKTACILRSMVLKPELLLLDDPTTGLNPVQVQQFVALIHELQAAGSIKQVYFVSQNYEFLKGIDHIEVRAEPGQFTLLENHTQAVGL